MCARKMCTSCGWLAGGDRYDADAVDIHTHNVNDDDDLCASTVRWFVADNAHIE